MLSNSFRIPSSVQPTSYAVTPARMNSWNPSPRYCLKSWYRDRITSPPLHRFRYKPPARDPQLRWWSQSFRPSAYWNEGDISASFTSKSLRIYALASSSGGLDTRLSTERMYTFRKHLVFSRLMWLNLAKNNYMWYYQPHMLVYTNFHSCLP